MNNDRSKGSAHVDKNDKKTNDDTNKPNEDKRKNSQDRDKKNGDKSGTVLGKINDDPKKAK